MKILHLSNLFAPSIGGLERHVATTALELTRRGHEVSVATLQPEDASWESLRSAGVEMISVPSLTASMGRFAYSDTSRPFHPTWRDLKVAAVVGDLLRDERLQVVHTHDWMVHSYMQPRRRSALLHVYTAHDYGLVCAKKTLVWAAGDGSEQHCSGPSVRRCIPCASRHYGAIKGSVLAVGLLRDQRRVLRSVDVLLAISSAVAREVEESSSEPRSVHVLPTFVPDGLAELAERSPRPDWLPRKPFWLFVGRLSRHKGLHVIFAAYTKISRQVAPADLPSLVCLGTPSDDDIGEVPDGAVVVQNVPHAAVMRCHAEALATIVPSTWAEPLGQVAVEAMLVGTPVIASRAGGIPDVVREGETGTLVPPGNVDALANTMLRQLHDEVPFTAMTVAARDHALKYTASRVIDELERIYANNYGILDAKLRTGRQ